MELQIHKHRNGFMRTKSAIEKGEITIGFLGGSITEGRDKWPEYVTSWFMEKFPGVRVKFENVAIGATGSALAIFRAEKEIIKKNCDLVFIEYAVNDLGASKEQRAKTREGLIRKLLANEERDLAIVYTFCQAMYADMNNGIIPGTIDEFEKLADYYGIGSVWMGLYAMMEVKRGWMRWEEWLPDGTHPGSRGSYSYAQSVIGFLERELFKILNPEAIPAADKMPVAINSMNWENTYIVPFKDIEIEGPWTDRRCENTRWIERVLFTCSPGSKLSFDINGRGIVLGFDFGKYSADFRYRIDEGDWVEVAMGRPVWCPNQGWFTTYTIGDDFENTKHRIEIEVIHGDKDECKGTNFNLAFAGVIQ